jgi:hypothetical protein
MAINAENVMEQVSHATRHPDVSPEQREARERVKRIRKLRWIGMEQEAQRLQAALGNGEMAGSVLAGSHETG